MEAGIHNHVHKSLPLRPVLNQINPVHNFLPYFSKIHSNVVLPSTPRSSKWSRPFKFPDTNFQALPMYPKCYTLRPSYPRLMTLMIISENYKL